MIFFIDLSKEYMIWWYDLLLFGKIWQGTNHKKKTK